MEQFRKFSDDFALLFSGSKDCYGVHVPDKNPKEGEKSKGQSYTKTEPLPETIYLKHLHGKASIGIVPIDKEGMISFAAIDVDVYPLNPVKYLTMLHKAKLPLVGFRSKSGGLHLFCFFNPPVKAVTVMPFIDNIRAMLGLKPATEIFPKQTAISEKGVGNWINLPYYNADKTERYAYSLDGKPLPLSVFLSHALAMRTTPALLKTALENLPLSEAPPCLQQLFLAGGAEVGNRNSFLLNCGVYVKARFGEAFADNLHALNNATLDPLDYAEMDKTVIASLNKKEYHYACASPLLKSVCNKEICRERKYGVGGQFISDFEFGQLTRYTGENDDDEYYIWKVNETDFTLYGINDLIGQERFRMLCGSKLNKIPNRLKEHVWIKIVNTALSNVKVVDDELGMGMSDKSHWQDKVNEFLSTRKALRPSQLNEGLVYLKKDKLYFKLSALQEFLLQTQTLRSISKNQHRSLLQTYGVHRGTVRINNVPSSFHYVVLTEQHKKGRLVDIMENAEREAEEIKKKVIKENDFEAILNFKEEEKF